MYTDVNCELVWSMRQLISEAKTMPQYQFYRGEKCSNNAEANHSPHKVTVKKVNNGKNRPVCNMSAGRFPKLLLKSWMVENTDLYVSWTRVESNFYRRLIDYQKKSHWKKTMKSKKVEGYFHNWHAKLVFCFLFYCSFCCCYCFIYYVSIERWYLLNSILNVLSTA